MDMNNVKLYFEPINVKLEQILDELVYIKCYPCILSRVMLLERLGLNEEEFYTYLDLNFNGYKICLYKIKYDCTLYFNRVNNLSYVGIYDLKNNKILNSFEC